MSRSNKSRKGVKQSAKSKDLPNSGIKLSKHVEREIQRKNRGPKKEKILKSKVNDITKEIKDFLN